MNRWLITACLALSPLAVAGNLAATPAFPGAPPVLWCCASRDRVSPVRPNPPAPPARGATVSEIGRVARRRRRRSRLRAWLAMWAPSAYPCSPVPRAVHGAALRALGKEDLPREGGESASSSPLAGEVPARAEGAPPALQTGHFHIEGMRCAACMQTIETQLLATPGIHAARVSFSGQRAVITWYPTVADPVKAVAAAGFIARPYDPSVAQDPMRAVHNAWLMRLGVAGFGAAATMFLAEPLYYASAPTDVFGQFLRLGGAIVGTLTGAYAAEPFLRGAWDGLKQRVLGMDALVSLGAIATYLASVAGLFTHGAVYFDALLMLLFLLVAGRYAEAAMRRRAYGAMERLLGQHATTCRVWQGDQLVMLAIDALEAGMELELAPGEQAPADGVVLRGHTHVVEAMLTGEPTPVAKGPGDTILGGTQNAEGAVRVRLTRVGADAAHARLTALVKEAAAGKSPLQRLVDRAGHIGTVAVAATAAATALGWAWADPHRALPAAVAVLVATCPCALGLATPAARALGLARALAQGALVKRGEALEALAGVRHVVFDKTGTLTRGEPCVVAVFGAPETLAVAAALELGSEHPLGRAIVAYARTQPAGGFIEEREPANDFRAEPGAGVRGTVGTRLARVGRADWLTDAGYAVPVYTAPPGATLVYVAHGEDVIGAIALADAPRPEAAAVVAELRAQGLGITMLTGDAPEAAAAVAYQLGITDLVARATPSSKLDTLRSLKARHGALLMVGDGLNDAPALAAADVGVAVARGGADLAVVTADVVLVGNLDALPGLLALSRRTVAVIHDNFRLSALYNLVAIPLAVAGFVSPLVAAIMMPLSSLAVMASALRLAGGSK